MIGTELAASPTSSRRSPAASVRAIGLPRSAVVVATLVGLVAIGAALRAVVADQSLFADELSTYWIVATHNFGGVISLMYGTPHIPHAEITPPLFFVLSWITSQLGHSPELVRLPSLLAGVATIPLVYLLGLRTVGRPAALIATVLTTLSPFMIYYSAEARSYGVMMLFTVLSTLAMLLALDTGRRRWWAVYGLSSCAAFYSHYTCGFLLLAQLLWLLWAHPVARRPALLANLGAVVLLAPWAPGLINDLHSPTATILSALSPFTASQVRIILEHWAIGFPYVEAGGLRGLPGTPALILLGLAAVAVVAGAGARVRRARARALLEHVDRRLILVALLALSLPVGEALVSAVGTHIFGVRNLAASWPALALCAGALIVAAGPLLGVAAAALAIAAFALGAAKMLTTFYARSDFRGAARFVEQRARPGDAVIDGTGVLSPGPLTGLDVALHEKLPLFRVGSPAERGHPFGVFDRVLPAATVVRQAVAAAHGGRVFVVGITSGNGINPPVPPPPGYELVRKRLYPNFVGLTVDVWAERHGG